MTDYKYKNTPMFRQRLSTQKVMDRLTLGLLAVYIFGLYNASRYGSVYVSHALAMLFTALIGTCGTEAIYAKVIRKDPVDYIRHSFPWVTALILVEIVPCDISLYAILVSSIIAIFFGKLAFGGFGQNIFNPAAIGRCIVTTSFISITSVELISSATPASSFASTSWVMTPESFETFLNDFGGVGNLFLGKYHGAFGETSALILGLLLIVFLVDGVVDWRVPLTYLSVCFISSLGIGLINGLGISYALAFLFSGGLIYSSVFMLTDPVTSPVSVPGRMVFAAVAAIITCLIRFHGFLPEGVCYGILIANMLSPMIDKIFSCKQLDAYRRNCIITYSLIVGAIAAIIISGCTITPQPYTTKFAQGTLAVQEVRELPQEDIGL